MVVWFMVVLYGVVLEGGCVGCDSYFAWLHNLLCPAYTPARVLLKVRIASPQNLSVAKLSIKYLKPTPITIMVKNLTPATFVGSSGFIRELVQLYRYDSSFCVTQSVTPIPKTNNTKPKLWWKIVSDCQHEMLNSAYVKTTTKNSKIIANTKNFEIFKRMLLSLKIVDYQRWI